MAELMLVGAVHVTESSSQRISHKDDKLAENMNSISAVFKCILYQLENVNMHWRQDGSAGL
jgi:hypothetical protein